jgi:hypothetical protein
MSDVDAVGQHIAEVRDDIGAALARYPPSRTSFVRQKLSAPV